jgi:uncharacterized protein (TIGR03067 family)
MLRWLIAVLAVGLLTAADLPRGDEKAEQQALQGTWKAVMVERNGKPAAAMDVKQCQLIISEDQFALRGLRAEERKKPLKMRLDPSRRPRAIDLTPSNFTAKDDIIRGIYERQGKALKIALGLPGKERPRDFGSEHSHLLLILERDTR